MKADIEPSRIFTCLIGFLFILCAFGVLIMDNNVVSASLQGTAEIDISISNEEIIFSNSNPLEGENISISAVIHGDESKDTSLNKFGVILDIGDPGEEFFVVDPSTIKLDNGTYQMWYMADPDSDPYKYRIHRAFSYDGINWTKQGMVLDYGSAYEENGVAHPHVIIDNEGNYQMWYTGIGYSGGYRYYIHRAVSYDDGITWQKLGRELTYGSSADPDGVAMPFVLFDGIEWRMWYSGVEWGSTDVGRICHAHKSTLAESWIKDGVVLNNDGEYDSIKSQYPFVKQTSEGYEMYYTGQDFQTTKRLLHAESSNGITWTRTGVIIEPTLPLEGDKVGIASVIDECDELKFWYSGYDGSNWRIFYAEEVPAKQGLDATCTVSFYLDSIDEFNLIDRVDNLLIPHDSDTLISIDWLAVAGSHEIIIELSNTDPMDMDMMNNIAFKNIEISVPEPVNQPPVADAGSNHTVDTGAEVQFDGSGSYDPDGTISSYEWDFGDGQHSNCSSPVHSFFSPGDYEVSLTVIDDDGSSDTDFCTVTVEEIVASPAKLMLTEEMINGLDVVETHTCYGWEIQITILNIGNSNAYNVMVYDVLPAELKLISYSLSQGSRNTG